MQKHTSHTVDGELPWCGLAPRVLGGGGWLGRPPGIVMGADGGGGAFDPVLKTKGGAVGAGLLTF
jgi:hypothetical protein